MKRTPKEQSEFDIGVEKQPRKRKKRATTPKAPETGGEEQAPAQDAPANGGEEQEATQGTFGIEGREDPEAFPLKPHPLTAYVPRMDPDGPEFAALLHDIEVSGQKEPIVPYEGKILDGRHRYEVCRILNREPWVATEEFKGTPAEALAYTLSVKDKRGTISKSQKAVMAYRLLKDKKISATVEKARREKIAATLKEGKARRMWETNSRNLTAEEKGTRARAIAADMLGINDRYVGYAAELADKAPKLLEDVFQGKISLVKAVKSLEPAPTAQKAGVRELRGVKRSLESIRQKLAGHDEALALVEKLEAELGNLMDAAQPSSTSS